MGLPATLHRKVFTKLKFQDYDFGEKVQMLIDESSDKMHLRAIKDMQKEDNVYLVDHAFTFKQRTAYKVIKENTKL